MKKKGTKSRPGISKITEKPQTGKPLFPRDHVQSLVLIAAVITLLLYLPALADQFVNWDDDQYVYQNRFIRSMDADFLKRAFFDFHAGNWHPLTWISHAADYTISELNPLGHHLSSVILHSLNTLLFGLLTSYLILNDRGRKSPYPKSVERRAFIAGGVAALLFGIHPVHVESVAWVSERKDVLSTFFVLLTIATYAKYTAVRGSDGGSGKAYYRMSLVLFLCALLSKPMAVTVPVMLMILDVYPFQRLRLGENILSQKRVLMEKVPFFLLSLALGILTIMAQRSGEAIKSAESFPFAHRIVMAVRGLYFYLEKMLLPVRLSPFYPYPTGGISLLGLPYLLPFLVVIGMSFWCILAWTKGKKIYAAVWTFYVVTLLPVLGIIQVGGQAAADRYAYIPSAGPFLLAGLGVAIAMERVKGTNRGIIFLVLFMVFSLLGILTIKQIKVWKDGVTLWTSVIERFPDYPDAYVSRADANASQGKYRETIRDLDHAITLNPRYHEAYNNQGMYYKGMGDLPSAIKAFSKAIDVSPVYAAAYSNRADVYVRLGDYQKALEDLNKAIELRPGSVGFYVNTCELYKMMADYPHAVESCSMAVSIDPDNAVAYNVRGIAYRKLGQFEESLKDLSKAIALDPERSAAYFERGETYHRLGRKEEAVRDFQKAARLGDKEIQQILKARGVEW